MVDRVPTRAVVRGSHRSGVKFDRADMSGADAPTAGVDRRGMETLREALKRLEQRGFREALVARPGGLLGPTGEDAATPEEWVVDEIVRFEGESDPGDEAVLFALHSTDGRIRGTFVSSYGPHTEPDCAAVIRRLRFDGATDRVDSSGA